MLKVILLTFVLKGGKGVPVISQLLDKLGAKFRRLLPCFWGKTFQFLMAAIFDLQHTQTSDSIHTGLIMLPDPENMGISNELLFYHSNSLGIAVRIPLLSRIRAEIYVISYLLPVNGGHL